MDQETKNKTIIFMTNFIKFLTDRKTIFSSSSLCILIIIFCILYLPTNQIIKYKFTPSNSLFSNMPYDL